MGQNTRLNPGIAHWIHYMTKEYEHAANQILGPENLKLAQLIIQRVAEVLVFARNASCGDSMGIGAGAQG